MRVFSLPEFSEPAYESTLFNQLYVVDDRNPAIIKNSPVPPENRVMAFRVAEHFSVWGNRKLDGSPDFRFNPIAVGGGDQWIEFSRLTARLEQALDKGDILENELLSAVPLMASKYMRGTDEVDAAVLTALEGWTVPVYFRGAFDAFSKAVSRLQALKLEIAAGTAASFELKLES